MSERIIFLDTETTGLAPGSSRIVEIAALEVTEEYLPTRVFHEYLAPGVSVGRCFYIHGLSDDFLRGRHSFRDIANNFVNFVQGATIYVHNLPFDQRFLDFALKESGFKPLASYASLFDTLPWARAKVGGSAKLDALVERFGIDGSARSEHHGALIDAELLLQVFLCLGGQSTKARKLSFDKINKIDNQYQQSLVGRNNCAKEDDEDDESYDDYETTLTMVSRNKNSDQEKSSSKRFSSVGYETKLYAIIDYASDHPSFDGYMYEDILDQYQRTGFLSINQMIAIDNVCDAFHII